MKHDYKAYTINPSTRYKNIPKKIDHEKILSKFVKKCYYYVSIELNRMEIKRP